MPQEITGISLRDLSELLIRQSADTAVLDAANWLLGATHQLSPGHWRSPGPRSWPLDRFLEFPEADSDPVGRSRAANDLVEQARAAGSALAAPSGAYRDRASRLAWTNCLLTYVAYFDALRRRMPGLMEQAKFGDLGDPERARVARAGGRAGLSHPVRAMPDAIGSREIPEVVISVPHPASPEGWYETRMAVYELMGFQFLEILQAHDVLWAPLGGDERLHTRIVVTEDMPTLADQIYRASLVGLADDYPEFLTWFLLSDKRMGTELIARITSRLREASPDEAALDADVEAALGSAGHSVDLGLKNLSGQLDCLSRAMARLSTRPADGLPGPSRTVAADLSRLYASSISRPLIYDRRGPDGESGPGYPAIADSFVPQAYRVIRYTDTTARLEQEDFWLPRPVVDDLGPFLLRYLESPFSTLTPLLILGHPGSGKSLLTLVLAARLTYPVYTTVRVQLRDVSAPDIQQQIEQQIRRDTGRDEYWPEFARPLPTPPVVIFDGYDELLQATGSAQSDYLERVRQFQEREAELGRPVRVIVTSRTMLIDMASIPKDTTVVRLEEFDAPHQHAWITVWNDRNRDYFAQTAVCEFQVPDNPRLIQLARVPLLLLMLAIYDSAANKLSRSPDIDETRLYYELIIRFIQRELAKDAGGFLALPAEDQRAQILRELDRLGVAAIGMFNRQALAIRSEDLNRDLAFFGVGRDTPAVGPRPLSQADLLLGSFLFILESRSRLEQVQNFWYPGQASYEFLDATFGEFLTADFLLGQILNQAAIVAKLAKIPELNAMLSERLDRMTPEWFGCLVHTPLHTRPSILLMLRKWAPHRPAEGMPAWLELLASLDRIVVAQLRSVLEGPTLPALAPQDRDTPYTPMPALGHLAIYTLNLILIRAYLSQGSYVLDERDLGDYQPEGSRPWNRLTAQWRSWFPRESLAALASHMTATRDGTQITISASPSSQMMTENTAFADAYNASLALADDLPLAGPGRRRAPVPPTPGSHLDSLRERVKSEAPI